MKLSLVSLSALGLVAFSVGCGASGSSSSGSGSLDQNGDGILDSLGNAVDANKDGVLDQIDIDSDGTMDGLGVDTNGDGFVDALGIDTNGDGLIDALDTDGDKVPDLFAPSGGSGGGTGTGGAIGVGTGSSASASGGTTASGGDSGGGTINVGQWNAFKASAAEATLASEYASWKSKYLKTDCGGGIYSVLKGSNESVSEGIGYGMLITATLGEKAEFDGLVAFYDAATKSSSGLMNWQCAACGSCGGGGPAPDGDVDVAMALLQAEKRWGGYADKALAVIKNLRGAKITETCGSFTIVRPGEWGGCSDAGSGLINPSYFSPGYYRAFAAVDAEGAATWNALLDSSYTLFDIAKAGHPDGLTAFPDAMKWTGSTFQIDKGFAYNGYDACRVPWRIAIDYAWSGDARAKSLLEVVAGKVDAWNWQQGGGLATDANSAFFGALALSGGAVSQEKADAYYTSWMNAAKDDTQYYQATLRVIYLLVAAGKFPSTL